MLSFQRVTLALLIAFAGGFPPFVTADQTRSARSRDTQQLFAKLNTILEKLSRGQLAPGEALSQIRPLSVQVGRLGDLLVALKFTERQAIVLGNLANQHPELGDISRSLYIICQEAATKEKKPTALLHFLLQSFEFEVSHGGDSAIVHTLFWKIHTLAYALNQTAFTLSLDPVRQAYPFPGYEATIEIALKGLLGSKTHAQQLCATIQPIDKNDPKAKELERWYLQLGLDPGLFTLSVDGQILHGLSERFEALRECMGVIIAPPLPPAKIGEPEGPSI